MAKRGDHIRKRVDGRWEGRFKKGRRSDGSILYGSVYGKTFHEVKEKLVECQSMQAVSTKTPCANQSFGTILTLWMEQNKLRLKGGTIHKYQNIVDTHILPELGRIMIADINAAMINSFLLNKRENGRINGKGQLSAAYIRSISLILSAALKFAAQEGYCLPLKSSLCKPPVEKKEIPILSRADQRQLEISFRGTTDPSSIGILISLHTGLRIGEVCALRWEDVDLENRILAVRHTVARVRDPEKTGSATMLILDTPKTRSSVRVIPITSTLLPILKKAKQRAVSSFVVSETETFVNPRTFENRFHRLLQHCQLAPINYHVLRHTFATRCIEAGVDIKSLSEILGHGNVSVTLNTYVHSSMELKQKQLEKLKALSA